MRYGTAYCCYYLLRKSCDDAVLSSLVVEALRVAVRVAVEVRGIAAAIGDGLSQQTGALGTEKKELELAFRILID